MNDDMARYCFGRAQESRAALEAQRPGFLQVRHDIERTVEEMAQVCWVVLRKGISLCSLLMVSRSTPGVLCVHHFHLFSLPVY